MDDMVEPYLTKFFSYKASASIGRPPERPAVMYRISGSSRAGRVANGLRRNLRPGTWLIRDALWMKVRSRQSRNATVPTKPIAYVWYKDRMPQRRPRRTPGSPTKATRGSVKVSEKLEDRASLSWPMLAGLNRIDVGIRDNWHPYRRLIIGGKSSRKGCKVQSSVQDSKPIKFTSLKMQFRLKCTSAIGGL